MKREITILELEQLKELQNGYNKTITDLGSIEIQIADVEEQLSSLINAKKEVRANIQELRQKESLLAKELSDKYGTGKIDINTGEITEN